MRIPRYDRRVWVIFFARMVTSLGFSVAMPFLSLYLNGELGIAMTVVGTILMVRSFTGGISQVVGGALCDRFGRKPLMVLALFFQAAVFVGVALAVAARFHFMVIAALLVANSVLGSLFSPASQAMVADVVEPERRIEAYGLIRIGANLGWAIGPAIGGLLATVSYAHLFGLTAATSLVAAVFVATLSRESTAAADEEKFQLRDLGLLTRDRAMIAFSVVCLLVFVVRAQLIAPFSVYTVARVGITKLQLGYLFTLNGLLVVVFQYPVARWIERMSRSGAMLLGSMLYAVGYFLVGLAPGFLALAALMTVITMGENIVSPASTAVAVNLSPANRRGTYLGAFGLVEFFGWSAGPLLGGIFLDLFPGRALAPWAFIGLVGVAAAAGFAWLRRRYPVVETGRGAE